METDPVCGMKVNVSDNTVYTYNYKGKTYHFCSETCKETFTANPDDYIEYVEENL
ncbi:MAG: hypothetical protein PWR10_2522 [Halanaerobiales bacterium]|nr:hypothetical protein [Halanaerobiales bacterium]